MDTNSNSDWNGRRRQRRARIIHLIWASLLMLILVVVGLTVNNVISDVNDDLKKMSDKVTKLYNDVGQVEGMNTAVENNNEAQVQWKDDYNRLYKELGQVKRSIGDRISSMVKNINTQKKNLGRMYKEINQIRQLSRRMAKIGQDARRIETDTDLFDNLSGKIDQHNHKLENIDSNLLTAINGISEINEVLSQVYQNQPSTNIEPTNIESTDLEP